MVGGLGLIYFDLAVSRIGLGKSSGFCENRFCKQNTISQGKEATVNDLNAWGLDQSTAQKRQQKIEQIVDSVLALIRQPLINAVENFLRIQSARLR